MVVRNFFDIRRLPHKLSGEEQGYISGYLATLNSVAVNIQNIMILEVHFKDYSVKKI